MGYINVTKKSKIRGLLLILILTVTTSIRSQDLSWNLDWLLRQGARFPYRIERDELETRVRARTTGKLVASYPVSFDQIAFHPDAKIWCGVAADQLHLFALEVD